LSYQDLKAMPRSVRSFGSSSQSAAHFIKRLRQSLFLYAASGGYYFVSHQLRQVLSCLRQRSAKLIFSGGNQFGGG